MHCCSNLLSINSGELLLLYAIQYFFKKHANLWTFFELAIVFMEKTFFRQKIVVSSFLLGRDMSFVGEKM